MKSKTEIFNIKDIIKYANIPNCKIICVCNLYDWKKILKIFKSSEYNYIAVYNKNIIHTCAEWKHHQCIKRVQYGKELNRREYEKYAGFISESYVIYFSKRCPEDIKNFVRQLYL